MRAKVLFTTLLSACLLAGAPVWAQSGNQVQSTLAAYRTPLKARVADRRFVTSEAMYLANEMNLGGDAFFKNALLAGLPVDEDGDFQYVTAVESYWYSRYNLSALIAESRLGVHLVFSPYVTERAIREGRGLDNRDRDEYVVSNKTELLERIVPAFLSLTGFPRRFEDASPCMLEFASGDPHYLRPLDKGTDFESPENLARRRELARIYGEPDQKIPRGMGKGGNEMWKYRINYRENFVSLRWDHDKMDHTLDMAAQGQTLMKEVLWSEYFFQSDHHDGKYLGNNAEEGFRGAMLTLEAVSKMLMLKSTLLYDGQRLQGINPIGYNPGSHPYYFPHRVSVRMRYAGDLPPRPEEFSVEDASSQLFDQASLLWGLSEYYFFSDPVIPTEWNQSAYYEDPSVRRNWRRVFGDRPPYDGSIIERNYGMLAQALANVVLDNIEAMHTRRGLLASEWTPQTKTGTAIRTQDAAMTMIALANYHRYLHVEKARRQHAAELLRGEANFLVTTLQRPDGSFPEAYDLAAAKPIGSAPTLLAQGFAIRGLLKAYQELEDVRYLEAAQKAYRFMNTALWDPQLGLYRSSYGATTTVYTPLNLGAALGAMREMILVTKDAKEVQRFKRFWVQAVDSSGIQQSEYEETGERDFTKCDGDGDGIPRMECGDGRYGIAPVYAARVEIETPLAPLVTTAAAR